MKSLLKRPMKRGVSRPTSRSPRRLPPSDRPFLAGLGLAIFWLTLLIIFVLLES